MKEYINLCKTILEKGEERDDRTGTGVRSYFGVQNRYNLEESFPLLTTKFLSFRLVLRELLWFISGNTNIKYLIDNNVHIWSAWPYQKFLKENPSANVSLELFEEKVKNDDSFSNKWGEIGPAYGKQWRDFLGVDQINELLQNLKNNKFSRRHIVTAWNPTEIKKMLLPPCHSLFQFYVSSSNELSCQLYQRSGDVFLGVPFNIASYSLLTLIIAKTLDLKPKEFIHTIGDAHIYRNHLKQVEEQISRLPKKLPNVLIKAKYSRLEDYKYEDFELQNYEHWPRIKGKISV